MSKNDRVVQARWVIGENLRKLRYSMKWSQAQFAKESGIAEPTLSNYINGNIKGLPPLDYLLRLCTMPQFKEKGLNLSLEMLISDKFDPEGMIKKRQGDPFLSRREMAHGDFLGAYLTYFFDQSKPVHDEDCKLSRAFRYGVIAVYNDYDSVTGEVAAKALAYFCKAEEASVAFALKKTLDHAFKTNGSVDGRNKAIAKAFDFEGSAVYEGTVTFSNHHTFINIHNHIYGDNALIVLYAPQKRPDTEYIGGLGSIASVARGRAHMPTAQKIILSKYELTCSDETVAEHLSMASAVVNQENEAEELCRFCRKLYSSDSLLQNLDESDRAVMVRRRMELLVRNYIEKNICCVGSVNEEEDRAVYKLIERSME